jgi:hypothetical protein
MAVILDLEVDSARPVVRLKKYGGVALNLGHPGKHDFGHSEGLIHHHPRPHHRYWVANLLVPTSMAW